MPQRKKGALKDRYTLHDWFGLQVLIRNLKGPIIPELWQLNDNV